MAERKRIAVDKEFLRVRIDLPSFQLDIATKDPQTALRELRKILETIRVDDDVMYEEFVTQELKSSFSETFVSNANVMAAVRKLLKQEDDYRIAAADIPTTATIDVEQQTRSVRVERRDLQQAVSKLTKEVDGHMVKHAIVHVSGRIERDHKVMIIDHIHQHMPTAQLRAFHSSGPEDKVVVECIFFGEFPEDEEE